MRVLFVDDEPRVLEGIERMLFDLDLEWEVDFATSGPEALQKLEQAPTDVLVSDMRMPGMDGATLLRVAQERFPSVVRIILSGHTDEEMALRTVNIAHQFLAKPCGPDTVRRVIERTVALQRLLRDGPLRQLLGRVENLPPAPRVWAELSKMLDKDDTSLDQVAAVVRQDPGISSKLLQVVNSSFFRRGAEISDVKVAVMRLGLRLVRNLALGMGAFEHVRRLAPTQLAVIDEIQRRAISIASIAQRLAPTPRDGEDAFSAGLVCDVGQLVLLLKAPDRFAAVRGRMRETGCSLVDAEKVILSGVTHAEVGAFLLGVWALPSAVAEAVLRHHLPRGAGDELAMADAVYVAACVVEGTAMDPGYVAAHGIEAKLAEARRLAEQDAKT